MSRFPWFLTFTIPNKFVMPILLISVVCLFFTVLILTNVCAVFSLFLLMVLKGKWKARQGLPTAGLLRHHLHLPHKVILDSMCR